MHLIICTFIHIAPFKNNRLDIYKQYKMWEDLRAFFPTLFFYATYWLLWAITSCFHANYIRVKKKVMAAAMATSAGTSMLQFFKLIGQIKVSYLNNILRQIK